MKDFPYDPGKLHREFLYITLFALLFVVGVVTYFMV